MIDILHEFVNQKVDMIITVGEGKIAQVDNRTCQLSGFHRVELHLEAADTQTHEEDGVTL